MNYAMSRNRAVLTSQYQMELLAAATTCCEANFKIVETTISLGCKQSDIVYLKQIDFIFYSDIYLFFILSSATSDKNRIRLICMAPTRISISYVAP